MGGRRRAGRHSAGGGNRSDQDARARRSRFALTDVQVDLLPQGIATQKRRTRFVDRLLSRRGAVLLYRNTIVSIGVFSLGLGLLWLLVDEFGMAKLPAAAISFIAANTVHYVFGRTWIYRGTQRKVVAGYAYFIVNAIVGLVVTLALFAGFLALGMHYIPARIVTSMFAGLVLFVLNAVLNFRSL
jgi:putative flippase GtrA